jgi:hypothetical protein
MCIFAILHLLKWHNINFAFDCGKYTCCYKTFLAAVEGSQTRNVLDYCAYFTIKINPYLGIFLLEHVIFRPILGNGIIIAVS